MGCNCNGEHNHKHGEECNCGNHDHHDHHGENDLMYITLEDGSDLKCEVVVQFEVEGEEYIVLLPENSESVFIYKYKEEDEEPVLSVIEDDEEFERVAEIYNSMLED